MANRFIQHIEKSIKQNWKSLAMTNFKTKQSYSYMDIARDITKLHILFEELNIHQEDSIALIGDNSPEWAIVYLATITYGAIIVPIPHNYKSDDVASIIENSKTKLLFIDNECWSRLKNKCVRGLRATFALEDYRCLWQTQGEILHLIMKRLPSIFHEKYPDGFYRDVIKYDEKDDNDICCSLFAFAEREVLGNEMFMRGKDYITLIKKFEYERHETSKANCLGGFSLADMYSSFFSIILPFVTGVHVTYIQTSSVFDDIYCVMQEKKPEWIIVSTNYIEKLFNYVITSDKLIRYMLLAIHIPILSSVLISKFHSRIEKQMGGRCSLLYVGGGDLDSKILCLMNKVPITFISKNKNIKK